MTRHQTEIPQFFLTAPAPCPYLPGREERKVFTYLVGERAATLNDVLTQGGFRRSQNIAYRPACESCSACVSIRIVVDAFVMSRGQKRVRNRNRDLIGTDIGASPSSDQYALFCRYLSDRHAGGGMAEMTMQDYAMMVGDSHVDTLAIEYRFRGIDSGLSGRGAGPLIAMALTDVLADGLSMVYSFFDPDHSSRSLGTMMVLDHIQRARRMGLPYVYLGYWVDGSPKMDYKSRFRPQERLGPNGWDRVAG